MHFGAWQTCTRHSPQQISEYKIKSSDAPVEAEKTIRLHKLPQVRRSAALATASGWLGQRERSKRASGWQGMRLQPAFAAWTCVGAQPSALQLCQVETTPAALFQFSPHPPLTPQTLMLHISRFSYDASRNATVKLHQHIAFPAHLKLRPGWLSEDCPDRRGAAAGYKLVASIIHHGRNASGEWPLVRLFRPGTLFLRY